MRADFLYIFIAITMSFISLSTEAQTGTDFDNRDPELNAFYQRGAYLVYDCASKHWVCTRKLEHKRCKIIRKRGLLEYDNRLQCAHFDQYKSNKLCEKELLRLTEEGRGDRFCLHPKQKGLKRDF